MNRKRKEMSDVRDGVRGTSQRKVYCIYRRLVEELDGLWMFTPNLDDEEECMRAMEQDA
jgi:hypothetical protein